MTENTNISIPKPPNPSTNSTEKTPHALPGILAGFARTFLANFTIGFISICKHTIMWWFRIPIKMFRPSAVNPWMVFSHLATEQNKQMTPLFIHSTIKNHGWGIVRKHVIPLMFANGVVGAVLFHSFSLSRKLLKSGEEKYWVNFMAGSIAGVTQSILSTPLDNLTKTLDADIKSNRHVGIHRHAQKALISFHKQSRLLNLFHGIRLNMARFKAYLCRDFLGFGMFFGTFQSFTYFGKSCTRNLFGYNSHTHSAKCNRPLRLKFADGFVVIGSGALAGASFQLIVYPLNRLNKQVEIVKHDSRKKLLKFQVAIKLLKGRGLCAFYNGISSHLIRTMPPSAIGLFVYEITSDWIERI
jgi:hypothetical protein